MTRALAVGSLGTLLALAAAAFDSPSLYVPGFGLMLLAAGAAAWVSLAAFGAGVERTVELPSVQEEDPYPVHLAAWSGLVPAAGGELVEPLLGAPLPMAWRPSRRVRVNVRFGRRGQRQLEPARFTISDPVGLVARELTTELANVLVLPRIEPLVTSSPDGGRGAAVSGLLEAEGAEMELDSLRPYRLGSPASRIHWPTVARTGTVMERRLTADAENLPLIVLDPRRPVSDEALDRAVRAAASLCVHVARLGGCALLVPGDRRPTAIDRDLYAWPHLHARLAVVGPGDGAPAPTGAGRAAAVFWVTAASPPLLAPALLRGGVCPRYLVTPVPRGGVEASFTVAGCAGQRLGRRIVERRAA